MSLFIDLFDNNAEEGLMILVIPVSKNFSAEEDSVILRMLQAVAVPVIGNVCHVFMHGLNRIQVYLDDF